MPTIKPKIQCQNSECLIFVCIFYFQNHIIFQFFFSNNFFVHGKKATTWQISVWNLKQTIINFTQKNKIFISAEIKQLYNKTEAKDRPTYFLYSLKHLCIVLAALSCLFHILVDETISSSFLVGNCFLNFTSIWSCSC